MIVADTGVWIDHYQNKETAQAGLLRQLLQEQPIRLVVADLVLTEVLLGVRTERQARIMEFDLRSLPVVVTGGVDIAVAAARNYRLLRSRGITVRKTIDVLIATRCIVDGHALLHRDRDFQPFVDHLGLIDAMTL